MSDPWLDLQDRVAKCSRCRTELPDVDVECPPDVLYPPGIAPPASVRVLSVGVAPPETGRHFYTDPSDNLRRGVLAILRQIDRPCRDLRDFIDRGFFLIHIAKCAIRGTPKPNLRVSKLCASTHLYREIEHLAPDGICFLSKKIGSPVAAGLLPRWGAAEAVPFGDIVPLVVRRKTVHAVCTTWPGREVHMDVQHRSAVVLPRPPGHQPVRLPLAGGMHHNRHQVALRRALGERVWLRRDHSNEFDQNAISAQTQGAESLGYIGRNVAAKLARYLDINGGAVEAVITELASDIPTQAVGVAVGLYLPNELISQIAAGPPAWDFYCDTGPDRWYVRLEEAPSPDTLRRILYDTLGPSRSHAAESVEEYIATFEREQLTLRCENESLKTRIAELQQAIRPPSQARHSIPDQQVGEIIQSLLPNVRFLRRSLLVIVHELENCDPVLRELRKLSTAAGEVRAKRVQRAPAWKELSFSTGQSDDGRLYFRQAADTWLVLPSFKASQERDFDFLAKN